MYFVPNYPDSLKVEERSNNNLDIVVEKWYVVLTTNSFSGSSANVTVMPFQSLDKEKAYVLKLEKQNAATGIRLIYLQVATRVLTSVIYKDKKIELEDSVVFERIYIFDGQSKEGVDIHILELEKLPQIIQVKNWDGLVENIEKNPKMMGLLHDSKSQLLYLDKPFTRVSELKTLVATESI